MSKVNQKKKENKSAISTNNNRLLISLAVILFYFLWPQIMNLLKQISIFGKNSGLLLGLISNLALIIVLISIYSKDLKEYIIKFKKNLKKSILTIIIFSIISIIIVPIINYLVIKFLDINEITANENSLLASFKSSPLVVAFMTIFYYPIVEEIVFEKTLKDVINSKWLFIILSGLFFWYYNIAYTASFTYVTIISSFYYFVLGFIRSLAFYKTDNLVVPIFIKSIYNTFVTLIS